MKGDAEAKPERAGKFSAAHRRSREDYIISLGLGIGALLLLNVGVIGATWPGICNIDDWLGFHAARQNYITAKKLLKPFVDIPVEQWSTYDPEHTDVIFGGVLGDVWFARGHVVVLKDGHEPVREPWFIFFRPATGTLLSVQVGERSFGDPRVAQQAFQTATHPEPRR